MLLSMRRVANALRRNRALVLVALVALAALAAAGGAWLARRRREGWFAGRVTEVKNEGHRRVIDRWCASGKKVSEILATYPQLEKYSFDAVNAVCVPAADRWTVAARGGGYSQKAAAADCKHGVCRNAAVRVTHPCSNRDGTKCCLRRDDNGYVNPNNLQNCVVRRGAMTYDVVKGVQNQIVADGCVYEARRELNGKDNGWTCWPGLLDTGVNWSDGVDPSISQRSCARTEDCKYKARVAFEAAGGKY
jgi:hypothetical protein